MVTVAIVAIILSLIIPVSLKGVTISSAQTSGPITQQWVNQQMAQWKTSSNSSVNFGVLFPRASYDNILFSYNTPQVENTSLNMLLSTGASCVRIDLGYDAWLKNDTSTQSTISSLVGQIRSAGRCFIIADASAESYRKQPLPWADFKTAWVQRVRTLAALFHPDYYIVIKEPGWYAPMVSDALTNPSFQDPNDWINLTQTLVSTVQSVSPNTKIGVSIAADSLSTNAALYTSFLTGVSKISGLSFIGFDIYTESGFQNTQNFLTQNGNGGKDVWIAECWSGDGSGIFSSTRATLDASWILLIYYFAQQIHALMLIPFYTDLFASYSLTSSSPTSASQILSLYQQRTDVYQEYRNIISAASGTQTSVTTTSSISGVGSTSQRTSSSAASTQSTLRTTSSSTSSPVSYASSNVRNRSLPLVEAGIIVVFLIVAVVVVVSLFFRRKG
ncbi:MAG TPA: hypothetical protein VFF30_05235 [Nitrososphaerales archaeon]|nr:hypothetical protein [Nitrososphaerales archaeon]